MYLHARAAVTWNTEPIPSPPPQPTIPNSNKLSNGAIAGIAVAVVSGCVVLAALAALFVRRNMKQSQKFAKVRPGHRELCTSYVGYCICQWFCLILQSCCSIGLRPVVTGADA